jgi:hypothetical protein
MLQGREEARDLTGAKRGSSYAHLRLKTVLSREIEEVEGGEGGEGEGERGTKEDAVEDPDTDRRGHKTRYEEKAQDRTRNPSAGSRPLLVRGLLTRSSVCLLLHHSRDLTEC